VSPFFRLDYSLVNFTHLFTEVPRVSHQSKRKALLDQIAAITTMQPGTLAEEWLERPDPDFGGTRRIGPYCKAPSLARWSQHQPLGSRL
jgi:hypothetical protein